MAQQQPTSDPPSVWVYDAKILAHGPLVSCRCQQLHLRSTPPAPALLQPPWEPWLLPTSELTPCTLLDATHVPWPRLDARRRTVTASDVRHRIWCIVAAIFTACCHHRIVAALPATCVFPASAACTLCKPTAILDSLEKFCSNLLKFHSNFEWIPAQIFWILSNSVSSKIFWEKNPRS
jgi:hypothetical protein